MAKMKQLTISSVDEDAEHYNSHTLLMEMQNATAVLETSLAISYKAKHMMQESHSLVYTPRKFKNLFIQKSI